MVRSHEHCLAVIHAGIPVPFSKIIELFANSRFGFATWCSNKLTTKTIIYTCLYHFLVTTLVNERQLIARWLVRMEIIQVFPKVLISFYVIKILIFKANHLRNFRATEESEEEKISLRVRVNSIRNDQSRGDLVRFYTLSENGNVRNEDSVCAKNARK